MHIHELELILEAAKFALEFVSLLLCLLVSPMQVVVFVPGVNAPSVEPSVSFYSDGRSRFPNGVLIWLSIVT